MKTPIRLLLVAVVAVAAWFLWRGLHSLEGEPAPPITASAWVLPGEAGAGTAVPPEPAWRLYAFFSPT